MKHKVDDERSAEGIQDATQRCLSELMPESLSRKASTRALDRLHFSELSTSIEVSTSTRTPSLAHVGATSRGPVQLVHVRQAFRVLGRSCQFDHFTKEEVLKKSPIDQPNRGL